jgi:multiple sugar transport system substrate-binding protein
MKKITKHVCIVALLLLAGAGLAFGSGGQGTGIDELQNVEITWWNNPWRIRVPGFPEDQAPDGTEFIEWASNEFMKLHPNVKVTGVMVSNAEYEQKQMAAIAAGTTPNVSKVRSLVELSKAGLVVPLDKYLTREDKRDFVPVALEGATVDGKVMGFPWSFGNNGMGVTNLIYPPMFEEAGVDWKKIVEKGWTMDEFVEVGKKISRDTDGDGENDIFLTGFQAKKFTGDPTDWVYVYNFGGRLLNDSETAFTVDSKEFIAGLQFIVDAMYEHKIAPKGAEALDVYGVIHPFHAHKLAMGQGGPYEIGRIDRYVKRGTVENFRPYVAPYPKAPGKKRGTYLTSGSFSVFEKAENDATREAAIEFARFVTSKDVLVMLDTVLYISARKSANEEMYKTDQWLEFKPDIERYAAELSNYGVRFFGSAEFSPNWTKAAKHMTAAVEAVYARTKTPEKAMADFIRDANNEIGF